MSDSEAVLGNQGDTEQAGEPLDRRAERSRDQHVIRRAIRRALAGIVAHKSLVACGNPLPGEDHTTFERDSNGRIRLGKVARCGSKQLCVTCAGRLRAAEAMLIAWRVFCHFCKGGGVSMITIAPRHQRGEALAPNKACLIESYNAAWRSAAMRAIQAKYGIIGTARVFEVTYGENGWHPHLHVLLFHERFLDITEGEQRELLVVFHREFNRQLAKWATKTCQHPDAARTGITYTPIVENGRPTGRRKATYRPPTNAEWYGLDPNEVRDADLTHGINFVPITPDGEAGGKIAAYVGKIQLEMTRSDLKTGKTDGSRSLFQIMNDYGTHNHPADGELIREAAAVLKGVHLVVWSGAFRGGEPTYGEPSEEFETKALEAWYEDQGIDPPDEPAEPIGGLAADVHRAADRATTTNGDPLLWKAAMALEGDGKLETVAQILNDVLAPVVIDRNTDRAYPIIRFAQPPTLNLGNEPTTGDDIDALRRSTRRLSDGHRQDMIALARANQGNWRPSNGQTALRGLDYWRNLTPEQIQTHAAIASRRLDDERSTHHGK